MVITKQPLELNDWTTPSPFVDSSHSSSCCSEGRVRIRTGYRCIISGFQTELAENFFINSYNLLSKLLQSTIGDERSLLKEEVSDLLSLSSDFPMAFFLLFY